MMEVWSEAETAQIWVETRGPDTMHGRLIVAKVEIRITAALLSQNYC